MNSFREEIEEEELGLDWGEDWGHPLSVSVYQTHCLMDDTIHFLFSFSF